MNIVSLIPLSKAIFKDELLYFSSKKFRPGECVEILVRNRKVPALVTQSEEILSARSKIRKSNFQLKKIDSLSRGFLLLPELIEAAAKTAHYFSGTTGGVISQITPSFVFKNSIVNNDLTETKKLKRTTGSIKIIQDVAKKRVDTYKVMIRERFAKRESVLIYVPHHQDVKKLYEELSAPIKKYVYILHGELTQAALKKTWASILSEKHPVLIISTAAYLSIPRSDISLFIVEGEARSHKTITRPFIDIKKFLYFYTRALGSDLVMSDNHTSLDTTYRLNSGEYESIIKNKRIYFEFKTPVLINMPSSKNEKSFRALSNEAVEIIDNPETNSHVFFYINRKGLAPITFCGDCGDTLKCTKCDMPLVLTERLGTRSFVCYRCNIKIPANTKCPKCSSWKLFTYGIGVETVVKELQHRWPDVKIFRIDGALVKNSKEAQKIYSEFTKHKRAFLVGTDMALPYLDKNIKATIVVSIDATLSLPDINTSERLISSIFYLRETTVGDLLIQTRKISDPIFKVLLSGDIGEHQNKELDQRRKHEFPPFFVLIKISSIGEKYTVEKRMEALENIFKDWGAMRVPVFAPKAGGPYKDQLVLRVDKSRFPDESLTNSLKRLPPNVVVDIEPASLL